MRAARVSELQYNKKSCVAAKQSTRYIAATQLIIFVGGFENLWPRAPYGALAIGYYSKRCSAALLPPRGTFPKKLTRPPAYIPTAVGARIRRARREQAPRHKKHGPQPNRPSAQQPKNPTARHPLNHRPRNSVILVPIDKMAVRLCHLAIGAIFAYTLSEREKRTLILLLQLTNQTTYCHETETSCRPRHHQAHRC